MSTRIIAEIGTAHNGSLKKGRELIFQAKEAGAHWAKFQIVFAREIVHPLTGNVPLPGGDIPLFQRFQELERPLDFYQGLKEICHQAEIGFFASPFGIESARFLKALDPGLIKIASPEVNHYPLLEEVSQYGWPIILSTGVSRLSDIEEALEVLPHHTSLLHCITSYPAPEEDYNLLAIPAMARIFGKPTGLSDHSLHPELVPGLAVALGAETVEKHFTLDPTGEGLDDPIALSPKDFSLMTRMIKQAEEDPEGTVKHLMKTYGTHRVKGIMGNGRKGLAPSERENYKTTNRSLILTCDLPAGTPLTEDNTALLRSEKQLKPGLHPRYWKDIKGAKTNKSLPSGHGVQWQDLLDYS